ncbi:MAG: nucleotidyltransferase family protein [Bacillota bacterium]|nr:nucleotidyltransferase family protein [Bacillota bacterium]
MKVCGIVAEYNPFHLGHELHIGETKRILGPDCHILCVMSGNYVQRGDFAVMSKHARAAAAVKCGADLVVELPTPYAVSSAEGFAKAAVFLLDATNIVSYLSFGSEAGSADLLQEAAEALLNDDFPSNLKRELREGASFAASRQKAVEALRGGEVSSLLSAPNNILGVEYIKALKMLRSNIIPVAVKRVGSSHDEQSANGNIASASFLRSLLQNESAEALRPYLPEPSYSALREEIKAGKAPVFMKNADLMIVSCLKKMKPEDFLSYADVSEGLEKRLYAAVSKSVSFEQIASMAKTKRYAHSRIRRILLSAYLGAAKEFKETPPPYLRVLAFNSRGREILRQMKETSALPVIVKPASVLELSENARRFFELESTASELYNLACPDPYSPVPGEYCRSPVFVGGQPSFFLDTKNTERI